MKRNLDNDALIPVFYAPFSNDLIDEVSSTYPTTTYGTCEIMNGVRVRNSGMSWSGLAWMNSIDYNNTDLTMLCDVKPMQLPSSQHSFYLSLGIDNNEVSVQFYVGKQIGIKFLRSGYYTSLQATAGTQYYKNGLAWDSANRMLYNIVNGVRIQSINYTGTLPTNVSTFYVGRHGHSRNALYDGVIANVRVYKRCLTDVEISDI